MTNDRMTNDQLQSLMTETLEKQLRDELSNIGELDVPKMLEALPKIGDKAQQIKCFLETVESLFPSEIKAHKRQLKKQRAEEQRQNFKVKL